MSLFKFKANEPGRTVVCRCIAQFPKRHKFYLFPVGKFSCRTSSTFSCKYNIILIKGLLLQISLLLLFTHAAGTMSTWTKLSKAGQFQYVRIYVRVCVRHLHTYAWMYGCVGVCLRLAEKFHLSQHKGQTINSNSHTCGQWHARKEKK